VENTKNISTQVVDAFIRELTENKAFTVFAEPIRQLLESEKAVKPEMMLSVLQTADPENQMKEVQA
jgi:hypothetical protein